MPRSMLSRASTENLTSLAAMLVHSVGGPRDGHSGQVHADCADLSACGPLGTRIVRRLGGLLLGHGLIEDAHDVALLHDQELDVVDLDLGARPFAEQHAVADPEVDRNEFPGLVAAARAYRGDLALRGLFLGGVGDDDAAGRLRLGIDALDDNTIVQWTEFHRYLLEL